VVCSGQFKLSGLPPKSWDFFRIPSSAYLFAILETNVKAIKSHQAAPAAREFHDFPRREEQSIALDRVRLFLSQISLIFRVGLLGIIEIHFSV
jgi:hypothetical protein